MCWLLGEVPEGSNPGGADKNTVSYSVIQKWDDEPILNTLLTILEWLTRTLSPSPVLPKEKKYSIRKSDKSSLLCVCGVSRGIKSTWSEHHVCNVGRVVLVLVASGIIIMVLIVSVMHFNQSETVPWLERSLTITITTTTATTSARAKVHWEGAQ